MPGNSALIIDNNGCVSPAAYVRRRCGCPCSRLTFAPATSKWISISCVAASCVCQTLTPLSSSLGRHAVEGMVGEAHLKPTGSHGVELAAQGLVSTPLRVSEANQAHEVSGRTTNFDGRRTASQGQRGDTCQSKARGSAVRDGLRNRDAGNAEDACLHVQPCRTDTTLELPLLHFPTRQAGLTKDGVMEDQLIPIWWVLRDGDPCFKQLGVTSAERLWWRIW